MLHYIHQISNNFTMFALAMTRNVTLYKYKDINKETRGLGEGDLVRDVLTLFPVSLILTRQH